MFARPGVQDDRRRLPAGRRRHGCPRRGRTPRPDQGGRKSRFCRTAMAEAVSASAATTGMPPAGGTTPPPPAACCIEFEQRTLPSRKTPQDGAGQPLRKPAPPPAGMIPAPDASRAASSTGEARSPNGPATAGTADGKEAAGKITLTQTGTQPKPIPMAARTADRRMAIMTISPPAAGIWSRNNPARQDGPAPHG